MSRCRDPQVKVTENLSDFWSLSHIIKHVYRLTLSYLLSIAIHKFKFVKNTHICGIWDQTFECLNTHFNSDFLFRLPHVFDQLGRCICIQDIGRSWIQAESPGLGVNHTNSCPSSRKRRYPFTNNLIIKCHPCSTWPCIPVWACRWAFNYL